MKRVRRSWVIAIVGFWWIASKGFAVEYPIIGVGIYGGWAQNELTRGGSGKIFLRYSLEAFVPGFNVEVGYATSFYSSLADSVIFDPDPVVEKRTIKTRIADRYPMVAGVFHLRPFGENTVIFVGGGVQLHQLGCQRKTTDRYWDEMAQKYQELEVAERTLMDAMKFGYQLLAGFRFVLGGFGSLDLEMRKSFLNVSADDWQDVVASRRWGDKSWSSLNINLGLTIYIF